MLMERMETVGERKNANLGLTHLDGFAKASAKLLHT